MEISKIVLPEGPLKRCTECGQLVSQCSEELYWNSMEEFDDPKGTIPCERSDVKRLVRRTNKIVSKIENLLGKDRREIHLLDVGCSSGTFISVVNNLGVNAEGVEPAAGPAGTAQAAGLRVYQGFLEEIQLPEESFDVVTVFEVIEHLKNPTGLVQECHRILRTGGLMVFRTGNTDSWTARIAGFSLWHLIIGPVIYHLPHLVCFLLLVCFIFIYSCFLNGRGSLMDDYSGLFCSPIE